MYKEGHKDKHDCYHQPGGITGGCWGGTRILAEKDCVQHIEDGDSMQFNDNRIVPYKDFEKEFPEWKLPQLTLDGANGEFRRMFFACYQKELADYYGKEPSDKCTFWSILYNRSTFKERLMNIAKQ